MKQQVIIHFYPIFSGTKSGLWLCLSILLFLSPSFPVSAQTENQLLKTVPSYYQRGENPPDTLYITEHKKKKFGVVNQQNEFIVPPVYKSISKIDPDCFLVEGKRKRYGLYNREGKMILPVEYSAIHFLEEQNRWDKKYIYWLNEGNSAVGFMNNWEPIFNKNVNLEYIELINDTNYSKSHAIEKVTIAGIEYTLVKPVAYDENGLIFYTRYKGYENRLINPTTSNPFYSSEAYFLGTGYRCPEGLTDGLKGENFIYGYINFTKQMVLPIEYDHFFRIKPNKLVFYDIESKSLVALKNEIILDYKFPDLNYTSYKNRCPDHVLSESSCVCTPDFIQSSYTWFLRWGDNIFTLPLADFENAFFYWPDDNDNIIWLEGVTKTDIINDSLLVYTDEISRKKGIKYIDGGVFLPATYDEIISLNAPANWMTNETYGRQNFKQSIITKVRKGDSLTLMNIYGKYLLPFLKYEDIKPLYISSQYIPNDFIQNYWKIYDRDTLCGVIDSTGNVIIPPKYKYINFIGNAHFRTWISRRAEIFNGKGEIIPYPEGFEIRRVNYNKKAYKNNMDKTYQFWEISKENGSIKGIIDNKGNIIIPPKYYSIYLIEK